MDEAIYLVDRDLSSFIWFICEDPVHRYIRHIGLQPDNTPPPVLTGLDAKFCLRELFFQHRHHAAIIT